MRNLSKSFLRVNAILSYVFMGLFILGAVIFFIVGSPLVSQHFEGEGAEAVVPLEKNTGWIRNVARQIHEFTIDANANS